MTAIQDWVSRRVEGVGLGPAAERVVSILVTQPHLASYATTADLAARANVNVATVVRTSRQLGFTGWPELRLELRSRYLASLSATEMLTEHVGTAGDPVTDAVRQDIANLQLLARTLETDVVRSIAAAIRQARQTLVIGSGTFAAPGLHLAHACTTMGLDVRLERHFGTQLANAVHRLGPEDCLVVVSLWWLPRQVLQATGIASERQSTVCVLTDMRTSPLAEHANQMLVIPSEGASTFPSLTAASSVVHALLAEMVKLGGEESRQAILGAEETWSRMDLFG